MSSQLLALPRELQWLIFDVFLAPLTIKRTPALDIYALPHQWPEHPDLGSFLTLASACKGVRTEALSYFEQRCLRKMTFYFDNMLSLYKFHQAVTSLKPEYSSARFSLRTRCPQICPNLSATENDETHQFMKQNTSDLDWERLGPDWYSYGGPTKEGSHKCEAMGSQCVHAVKHRGKAIIDIIHFEGQNGLKLVHRGIRSLRSSNYWEMLGTLGALSFKEYDPVKAENSYLQALCDGGESLRRSRGGSRYSEGMEKLVEALDEDDG